MNAAFFAELLDALGALAVLLAIVRIVTFLRVQGRRSGKCLALMLRIAWDSRQWFTVAFAGFVLVEMLVALFMSWPAPFGWFGPGAAIYLLVRTLSPPAILFLAASQDRGMLLLMKLQFLASPLKVSHLIFPGLRLRPGPHSFLGISLMYSFVNLDGYRVRTSWQKTVRALSEVAPLIIIDARTPSPALTEELAHNVAAALGDRTFIVYEEHGLDEQGSAHGLQGMSYPFPSEARFVSSVHLQEALKFVAWSLWMDRRITLPQLLENRIRRVKKHDSVRAGESGRCDGGCGRGLGAVLKWQEELTREQRVELDSYYDSASDSVYQCRQCGRRYCLDCIMEFSMCCLDCEKSSLRQGYTVLPEG